MPGFCTGSAAISMQKALAEAYMPELPESDWLPLREAHDRALAFFADSDPAAIERAILTAIYDGKIKSRGRCEKFFRHGERVPLKRFLWDPELALAKWDSDCFVRDAEREIRREPIHRLLHSALLIFIHVQLRRRDFEKWLGQAKSETVPSGNQATPPTTATGGPAEAAPPAGIRTNRAARAEEECGRCIAGLKTRPENKEDAYTDAKAAVAHIGPLSRKAFERQWGINALPEWKCGGRRKISPPSEI